MGKCDKASVRDGTVPSWKVIKVRTHIILENGKWPHNLTMEQLEAQHQYAQEHYNKHHIQLQFVKPRAYKDKDFPDCIPMYQGGDAYYYAIQNLKKKYSVDPEHSLNVIVSCQASAPGYGILLGMGTFPWDPAAITSEGGVWMNPYAIQKRHSTYVHEIGHNLGLWHTFHGVSELSCRNDCLLGNMCTWDCACQDPCFEGPHAIGDPAADEIGDFASDTAATSKHWDCGNPKGEACSVNSWGETSYQNMMSYSACRDNLTPQQESRAHCWLCEGLSGLVSNDGCSDPLPSFSIKLGSYDLLSTEQIVLKNSNVGGSVLGCKNAIVENFSVGQGLSTRNKNTFIVDGDIAFSHGTVYDGNVVYGGTAKVESVDIRNGKLVQKPDAVNCDKQTSKVQKLSAKIANLPPNARVLHPHANGTKLVALSSKVNVWNLDLDPTTTDFTIEAAEGSWAIINVHGCTTFQNMGITLTGGIDVSHVLFNILDSTTLRFNGVGFPGSVLAPNSIVSVNSAYVEGQLICGGIRGTGELRNNLFAPTPKRQGAEEDDMED
eukprot:TRINITY_DN96165_c0_g1_i1.p1 TRINITY_DN96165_c0_g1~~TRINITY_DN96165_c0_g1_i1.p1  ORF type:complete len:617 (-),score=57.73 TRINITY_DN96165_c0_g1_i1:84-1727(-)